MPFLTFRDLWRPRPQNKYPHCSIQNVYSKVLASILCSSQLRLYMNVHSDSSCTICISAGDLQTVRAGGRREGTEWATKPDATALTGHGLNPQDTDRSMSISVVQQTPPKEYVCHLVFVELAVLQFRLALLLERDDDERNENIDKEEGENDEIDDIEERHLDPVVWFRPVVLWRGRHGVL